MQIRWNLMLAQLYLKLEHKRYKVGYGIKRNIGEGDLHHANAKIGGWNSVQ